MVLRLLLSVRDAVSSMCVGWWSRGLRIYVSMAMIDFQIFIKNYLIFGQAQCFFKHGNVNEFFDDLSSFHGTILVASQSHLKHLEILQSQYFTITWGSMFQVVSGGKIGLYHSIKRESFFMTSGCP